MTYTIRDKYSLPAAPSAHPVVLGTLRSACQDGGFADNSASGSGQLCFVVQSKQTSAPNTTNTYLCIHNDAAATASYLLLQSGDYFDTVLMSDQDSAGKLYFLILNGSNQLYYYRYSLSHTSGAISGATLEASFIVRTLTNGADSKAALIEIDSGDDTKRLALALSEGDGSANIVPMFATWPITATSATDVKDASGATGFTTLPYRTGMPLHGHACNIEQVPSTKGILFSIGESCAEFPTKGLSHYWLTPSGDITWNTGSRTDLSDSNPLDLGGVCATETHIYRAGIGNSSTTSCYFERFSDTGTRTDNIFPAVDVGDWAGWVLLHVSPDESAAYFIVGTWNALHRIAKYSGGSWTVNNETSFTDIYGSFAIRANSPKIGMISVMSDIIGGIAVPRLSSIFEDESATPGLTTAISTATASAFASATVRWSGEPPTIAATNTNQSGASNVTTFNADIGSPTNGERVVLIVSKDGSADFSTTPATSLGWTVAANNPQGTAIRSIVLWKNCDGTEGANVPFTVASGESFVAKYYRIAAGSYDTAVAPAVAVNAVATANNNPAALTPSWGAANNLWICTLAQDTNSTAPSAYPSGYTLNQGTSRSTNSTTGDRTRLTWCNKTANAASDDPAAWTSSAVASVAYTIAIKPYVSTVVSRTLSATQTGTASSAQSQSLLHASKLTANPTATASVWSTIPGAPDYQLTATSTGTTSEPASADVKRSRRIAAVVSATTSPASSQTTAHTSKLTASATSTVSGWLSVDLTALIRRSVQALVTGTTSNQQDQSISHKSLVSASPATTDSSASTATVRHGSSVSASSEAVTTSWQSQSSQHNSRLFVSAFSSLSPAQTQTVRRTRTLDASTTSTVSSWATQTITYVALIARTIVALVSSTLSPFSAQLLRGSRRIFATVGATNSTTSTTEIRHFAFNSFHAVATPTGTASSAQSVSLLRNYVLVADDFSLDSIAFDAGISHRSDLSASSSSSVAAWQTVGLSGSRRVASTPFATVSAYSSAGISWSAYGEYRVNTVSTASASPFVAQDLFRNRVTRANASANSTEWTGVILAPSRHTETATFSNASTWTDNDVRHNSTIVATPRASLSTWLAAAINYSGLLPRAVSTRHYRMSTVNALLTSSVVATGISSRDYEVKS